MSEEPPRPPLPPFTRDSAIAKVQAAEDAWNTRDPVKISKAYSTESDWRNRSEFFKGREQIVAFLTKKWEKELDYRLRKTLFTYHGNRIAVTFEYEYHNAAGEWFRAYGNENWDFNDKGYMERRQASINDVPIQETDRNFRWERQ